jgi:uncharacterized protein (DUF1697 family)
VALEPVNEHHGEQVFMVLDFKGQQIENGSSSLEVMRRTTIVNTYVAFLRGINSGLNPTTKMDVLKAAFEEMGFKNVKTVIASGNVLFEAESTSERALEQKIEKTLPKAIGFESTTIVYKLEALQRLVKLDPFKDVKVTPQTRTFVTFVKEPPKGNPKLAGKGFQIIKKSGHALFSVLDLAGTTPDLMKVLDKEFGKGNTTRSWKTIERMLKKAEK